MTKGKFFLLKLSIIAISIIAADTAIGKLLSHFYFRIANGEQGRLTYVIDSTTNPILILGSSRAAHHYVTSIISTCVHRGCTNAGKDKQGLYFDLAILKLALKRYRPQNVILDMTPVYFAAEESGLDELAVLLPYWKSHPEIKPILDKRSSWEWLKMRSALYSYNSLPLQIIFNNLSHQRGAATDGYIPRFDTLAGNPLPPFTFGQITAAPDTMLVNAFKEIIRLTRRNDCRLAVVVSPLYYPLPGSTSTIQLSKKLCMQQQIPFLDYTNSTSFCYHESLFSDEQHLNNAGAQIFTHVLCADLAAKGFWETTK